MTFRKRRRPTPGFGVFPPYNAITGVHANLRAEGIHPYCAMMQVAAEDEYDDYVICRGFDPRIRKFIDYEEANADKPGISVAKPFGNRVAYRYQIGQVYPAFLPTQGTEDYTPPSPTAVDWRVGQNPGTVPDSSTGGHPQSLADTIEELTDHNDKYVNWMLIDSDPAILHFELAETLDADSTTGATAYRRNWDSSANAGEGGYVTDTGDEFTVKDTREVGYYGSTGAKGACIMKTADNGAFGEICDMECP